jgi:prepilin-type N-terminal cleavage/methylation domain-containing protein
MQDYKKTKGFTFLELLIALALFSAGLLGLLQLQFLAQRQLQETLYVTRAFNQAYNLSALLTIFEAAPGSALAQQLLQHWNADNAQVLPNGVGTLEHDLISVSWQSPLSIEKIQLHLGK